MYVSNYMRSLFSSKLIDREMNISISIYLA